MTIHAMERNGEQFGGIGKIIDEKHQPQMKTVEQHWRDVLR